MSMQYVQKTYAYWAQCISIEYNYGNIWIVLYSGYVLLVYDGSSKVEIAFDISVYK